MKNIHQDDFDDNKVIKKIECHYSCDENFVRTHHVRNACTCTSMQSSSSDKPTWSVIQDMQTWDQNANRARMQVLENGVVWSLLINVAKCAPNNSHEYYLHNSTDWFMFWNRNWVQSMREMPHKISRLILLIASSMIMIQSFISCCHRLYRTL